MSTSQEQEYVEKLPEWMKKVARSKYRNTGFGANYKGHILQEYLADIDERLTDIEHKINPTAKKVLSNRSQQMLMLHHLGVLDKLNELKISNKKIAKLLSILLNASPDNIEGDLSVIHNPKSKLKTIGNYKVVSSAFKEAGIKPLISETEQILDKLIQSK